MRFFRFAKVPPPPTKVLSETIFSCTEVVDEIASYLEHKELNHLRETCKTTNNILMTVPCLREDIRQSLSRRANQLVEDLRGDELAISIRESIQDPDIARSYSAVANIHPTFFPRIRTDRFTAGWCLLIGIGIFVVMFYGHSEDESPPTTVVGTARGTLFASGPLIMAAMALWFCITQRVRASRALVSLRSGIMALRHCDEALQPLLERHDEDKESKNEKKDDEIELQDSGNIRSYGSI